MLPKLSKAGKLTGNPKLHKHGVPYRAIVNGRGTATERIAEVAEAQLDEYVKDSPSYIKDTTDFLNKLKEIQQPLPKDIILFCFDVVKLYPSIPKREGLSACEEALNYRTCTEIPTKDVMGMISTVLENNNFCFNGKDYLQTEGVAIGSKLGKNYACTYMRKWDEQLLHFHQQPLVYKRYIDDGFGLWTHGEEALQKFQAHANKIHDNIKVILRWNRKRIEFLDTWVISDEGRIKTDLFVKESDKHMYVDSKSDHPNTVKKSIPYGLAIRLKRICSEEADYKRHRAELKYQLRGRGYDMRFIERQLKRVDPLKREDLLQYRKGRQQSNRVPLVLTFAKQLPDVQEIVHKRMSLLYKSDRMKQIFQQPPVLAFRRDRNISDVLVHGKLNRLMRSENVDEGQCKCKVCERIVTENITSGDGNRHFTVRNYDGCRTKKCSICDDMQAMRQASIRWRDGKNAWGKADGASS